MPPGALGTRAATPAEGSPVRRSSLRLRDAVADDRDLLRSWRTDPATLAASFDRSRPTLAAHAAWFARELADPDRLCWILEVDGLPAGQVRFAIAAREATLGYVLGPSWRGRGLASAFVRLALERLRAERPQLRAVIADVRPGNTASVRTLERAGFAPVPPDPAIRAERPGVAFARYRLATA